MRGVEERWSERLKLDWERERGGIESNEESRATWNDAKIEAERERGEIFRLELEAERLYRGNEGRPEECEENGG